MACNAYGYINLPIQVFFRQGIALVRLVNADNQGYGLLLYCYANYSDANIVNTITANGPAVDSVSCAIRSSDGYYQLAIRIIAKANTTFNSVQVTLYANEF